MCEYTGCKDKCHIFYKIVFFNVPASAILLRIYIFEKQVLKLVLQQYDVCVISAQNTLKRHLHPVQGCSSQICFFFIHFWSNKGVWHRGITYIRPP